MCVDTNCRREGKLFRGGKSIPYAHGEIRMTCIASFPVWRCAEHEPVTCACWIRLASIALHLVVEILLILGIYVVDIENLVRQLDLILRW